MTMIAMITAAIITGRSSAMPTAVITESSEKTMSSITIWTTAATKVTVVRAPSPSLALGHVVDLHRPLDEEEEAARTENEVAPRVTSWPKTLKAGLRSGR